jgi:hypothetical protein
MKRFKAFYDGFMDVYVVLFSRWPTIKVSFPTYSENKWFEIGNICAILSIPVGVFFEIAGLYYVFFVG